MFNKPTKEPMKNLIRLEGQTAVITGSASGIGAAMAYRFAEAGADLVLVDLNQAGLGGVQLRHRRPHPRGRRLPIKLE